MREAIASAAGLLTSLLLETVPYVRDRWSRNRFKVLTLLLIYIGSALAIWFLHCVLALSFPFIVPCGYQGVAELGWAGFVAFGSSQLTYQVVTKHLPRVKARRVRDAASFVLKERAKLLHTSWESGWDE